MPRETRWAEARQDVAGRSATHPATRVATVAEGCLQQPGGTTYPHPGVLRPAPRWDQEGVGRIKAARVEDCRPALSVLSPRIDIGPGRACLACGLEISPNRRSRFCTRPHQQQLRACADCGNEFVGSPGDRFCAPTCGVRFHRRADRDRRRAARRTDKLGERLFRSEIADRDGWRCHLCRRPVNRRRHYPDPLSASLDHLVPLSAGGEHVESNVALAHLRCNIRRSASGPAQLLLGMGAWISGSEAPAPDPRACSHTYDSAVLP